MNIEIKLSYQNQKLMKKLQGKIKAREIAFGRMMVKMLKKNYDTNKSQEENDTKLHQTSEM